ncbi:c-type cytochrome biogenesis protein CcmI [Thalassobaculum salexigens]|uniref:c-type cytochrome biogenesis protein CcmI n=1 Tax=Thalassobaculum salexigens TaxID=455360 RepID=UPI000420B515|nr:c-type cytochrome biogenesis protein CcmI [Thalassobaculum salexigens]
MMFWAVAGVLVLAAVLALIAPLVRRRQATAPRAEHGLAVLKDQLAEIERDRAAGRLADAEADAARIEVERRILAEADRDEAPTATDPASTRWRRFTVAALIIVGVPAATAAVYLHAGSPGMPDLPLSARADERTRMAELAQRQRGIMEMVQNLEQRLGGQPDDLEGWMLLGRSRLALGDFEQAAVAFRRAAGLGGGAEALGEMAEALVRRDRGIVTPDARQAFRDVLEIAPADPRARYYLALGALQAGDAESALRQWLALAADTPPDAPWRAGLMQRMEDVAAENGIDLAALGQEVVGERPTASGPRGPSQEDVAAAQSMSSEDRLAMIRGMVDGLQARLEADPSDIDGWLRLGRSWQVLGEPEKSVAAYKEAAERAPDRADVQLDYARALFPPGTANRAMPQAFIDTVARVREIEPENPEGLFFGGMIAARKGDTEAARDLWTRLLERLPEDSPIRAAIQQRLAILGEG